MAIVHLLKCIRQFFLLLLFLLDWQPEILDAALQEMLFIAKAAGSGTREDSTGICIVGGFAVASGSFMWLG